MEWYRKAADAGNAYAMFEIGNMYLHDRQGIPKDHQQAVAWYRKAAAAGHPKAIDLLKRHGINP